MLDLSDPQPEKFFGMGAIQGMSEDYMACRIFATFPDAILSGESIPTWPRLFNAGFSARRKTW